VEQIPDDEFVRIVDPQTGDENCRSQSWHAIVHLLRHRRQIEKFMLQGKITARSDV